MRSIRIFLTAAILSLAFASTTHATEPPPSGSVGLMATLQSEQMDMMVPLWASPSLMVAPVVRFISIGDAYTDLGFGAALRVYKRHETVSPYFGVRGMALIISPDVGDGWTDIVFGGMFGGDYFLAESFSLGVEAQLNVTLSDDGSTRFGNPGGTNINSAMGVFAAVYF